VDRLPSLLPPCPHPSGRGCSASSPGSAPRCRSPCWPSRPGGAASTRARAVLAERTTLPDPLLGGIEDLLAVALAVAVLGAGRGSG